MKSVPYCYIGRVFYYLKRYNVQFMRFIQIPVDFMCNMFLLLVIINLVIIYKKITGKSLKKMILSSYMNYIFYKF